MLTRTSRRRELVCSVVFGFDFDFIPYSLKDKFSFISMLARNRLALALVNNSA